MRYTVEKSEGIPVIVIQGDLWGGTETCDLQGKIKEELVELIHQGKRRFILDLEKTLRVNSLGIGMLVAIHVSIRNAGGELRICSVNERPRAALEITGLKNLFKIHETRASAVEAFTARV